MSDKLRKEYQKLHHYLHEKFAEAQHVLVHSNKVLEFLKKLIEIVEHIFGHRNRKNTILSANGMPLIETLDAGKKVMKDFPAIPTTEGILEWLSKDLIPALNSLLDELKKLAPEKKGIIQDVESGINDVAKVIDIINSVLKHV